MVSKSVLAVILLVSFLITISLVSAYDTQITVTTLQDVDIELKVLENPFGVEGSNLIEIFNASTGDSGVVTFTCSAPKPQIYVTAMLSQNGRSIRIDGKSLHRFPADSDEFYAAGKPLSLSLLPGQDILAEAEEETEANITANETNTTEETAEEITNETETQSGITGQAISGEENGSATEEKFSISDIPNIAYIIVAVIIIGSLIIFLGKVAMSRKGPEKIKLRKYSDMVSEREENERDDKDDKNFEEMHDKELLDAERKLKELQEEIRGIKEKRSKKAEAERKFEEAKRELERIEKEESS